jgi:DNA primase
LAIASTASTKSKLSYFCTKLIAPPLYFINDLPNQIDIVDLISKRLTLKKVGGSYRAPCPFHGGKNPNFAVNGHEQFYHCFKCGESGGAISFVQKYDNLDFVEAVEAIANEFGLKAY